MTEDKIKEILQGLINGEDWEYQDVVSSSWMPVKLGDQIKNNCEYRKASKYYVYFIKNYIITQELYRMPSEFSGTKTQCEQYVSSRSWAIFKHISQSGKTYYFYKTLQCKLNSDLMTKPYPDNAEFVKEYYGSERGVKEFIELNYKDTWLSTYLKTHTVDSTRYTVVDALADLKNEVFKELRNLNKDQFTIDNIIDCFNSTGLIEGVGKCEN